MLIYIITIFILFLFAAFDLFKFINPLSRNAINIFLFLLLVVQTGFRWETGTDWTPYLENFKNTDNIAIVVVNSLIGFEPGYGFFVYLVHTFTDSYTVFLVIHAFIYYLLIFKANNKISPFPFVSLLLFYVSTIGVLGSNRQLIALSICLYSMQFIYIKQPSKFFSLVILAFFFHTTALIFLVFYFLNRDFKKYQVFGILLFSFIVGNTSLPNFLFSNLGNILGEASASKALIYSEKGSLGDFSLSTLGIIRRFFYFFIFFISYDSICKKFISYKLLFNGFLFGLIFYFLFSNSLLILVNRGSLYFNVMEVFLITCQLLIFRRNRDKFIFLVLFFFYSFYLFFQSISVYSDLFLPYKGVFINTDFNRSLY